MRTRTLPFLALAGAGCGADGVLDPPVVLPVIETSAVAANPHNVLSAVVTTRVRGADSVAVRVGTAGGAQDTITPATPSSGEPLVLPVLGLRPATTYALQVLAYHDRQVVPGDTLTLTTGALPEDLPAYAAEGGDPSPGYVAFAAGQYGLVIDNTGRVAWYRHFPGGAGLNFQAQPNGTYAARPPSANPTQPAAWVALDPLGDVTRHLGCHGGLQPRFHDLLVQADGAYWIMCDEVRTMDLAPVGGDPAALVLGTVVQQVSAAGALLFQWRALDHFDLTDLEPSERTGPAVNFTHGNAIDLDTDGHLLVSFRALSEVTKIHAQTGQVIWRMGGRRNQFTFEGAPGPSFARQHGVRAPQPGQLLLLDNLGDPLESRAERYAYDASARTVRLVGTLGSLPPVSALLGGTTQDLPGGRTLVSFGSAGRVEEYDATGQVVWRLVAPGYVFRAQRIRSLYRPGIGSPR